MHYFKLMLLHKHKRISFIYKCKFLNYSDLASKPPKTEKNKKSDLVLNNQINQSNL